MTTKATYCSRERALREKLGPRIYDRVACPTCGQGKGRYCKLPSGLVPNKLHESRLKLLEVEAAKVQLVDGREYWLGATWGKYDAKDEVFLLGNCFVRRGETRFSNERIADVTPEDLAGRATC